MASTLPKHLSQVGKLVAKNGKATFSSTAAALQKTFRKVQVRQLSPDFREATEIAEVPLSEPNAGEVVCSNLLHHVLFSI